MNSPPPSQEIGELSEVLSKLLEELSSIGEILYDALHDTMETLQSGRSPRGLKLSQQLEQIEEDHEAFKEALKEMSTQLDQADLQDSGESGKELFELLPQLESEEQYWQTVNQKMGNLIKRLKMMSQSEQLTSLGMMSLEDPWKELKAFIKKVS